MAIINPVRNDVHFPCPPLLVMEWLWLLKHSMAPMVWETLFENLTNEKGLFNIFLTVNCFFYIQVCTSVRTATNSRKMIGSYNRNAKKNRTLLFHKKCSWKACVIAQKMPLKELRVDQGENMTRCEFGNWTGIPPICEEIYCPFPGRFTVYNHAQFTIDRLQCSTRRSLDRLTV